MISLPEAYLQRIRRDLGPEAPDYLHALEEAPPASLHVNTLKITRNQLMDRIHGLIPVCSVPEGCYITEGQLSRHPYYAAGLYYLQEASAMNPAARLPISPGDRVLDLCAAPGGKTTQLALRLRGTGALYANDISVSRAQALLKNVELAGIGNCFITAESHEKLHGVFREYFDKILVDAPCSGEGMFRREPSVMKDWIQRGPAYYAPIQRDILDKAFDMLKPDGMLLYSTCTFSAEEDEDNVEYMLRTHPELELISAEKLWPHRYAGEGQFLALFRKAGAGPTPETDETAAADETSATARTGIGGAAGRKGSVRTQAGTQLLADGRRYRIPCGEKVIRGLRYVRTGLYEGDVTPNGFVPSQALALSWDQRPELPVYDMEVSDPDVIRYLKGETISVSGSYDPKDWILVTTDGFALGLARPNGSRLKNKYPKGWRMQ